MNRKQPKREFKQEVEYEFMGNPVTVVEVFGDYEASVMGVFGERAIVKVADIGKEWSEYMKAKKS